MGNSKKALGPLSPEISAGWGMDPEALLGFSHVPDVKLQRRWHYVVLSVASPFIHLSDKTLWLCLSLPSTLPLTPAFSALSVLLLLACGFSGTHEHPISWMITAWSPVPPGHPWDQRPQNWEERDVDTKPWSFLLFTLRSSWLLTTKDTE